MTDWGLQSCVKGYQQNYFLLETVQGWCVVHGMTLYRPPSSWAPLLLCGGLVYVQDGENLVPFHLSPLRKPVPNGLSDNYICEDCVVR